MGKRNQKRTKDDTSPAKCSKPFTNQPKGNEKRNKHSTTTSSGQATTTNTKPTSSNIESGELDLTTPEGLLTSLLAPAVTLEVFSEQYWEKKPLVIHRGRGGAEGGASESYYGLTFSREILLSLLAEHRIEFEQDINVCRYVDSKRENLNGSGRATTGKIKNLFDQKKATVQFHQPQRFQDKLWQICELLETYFQSLVGANVYMTPGGSQGLAPHYDDVEVLILQSEGRKHWRLYAPPIELPRDYSRDLNQDDIGQPTHDFVLETGDLLYFPRGTVHQADTPSECPYSTHVTISTYQRSSYGDILGIALPGILRTAISNNVEFRRGLQTGFLTNLETGSKSTIENLLGQLSNHIGDNVQQATNQMMCDFAANRLPPYRSDHFEPGPIGPMPTAECKVKLTFPRHTFVVLVADEDTSDSDYDEEDIEENFVEDGTPDLDASGGQEPDCSTSVFVRHSVANSRTEHMMGTSQQEPKGLRFPVNHYKAICQLKKSVDFMDSRTLDLTKDDTRNLLVSLWAEGLLEASIE